MAGVYREDIDMYKDDQIFQVLLRYDFDLNRNELDVPSYLENHLDKYTNDIESAASGSNPLLRVIDRVKY